MIMILILIKFPKGDQDVNPLRSLRALLPRIGFRDNQTNRVLIKSLETALSLQVLHMTTIDLRP
jgi:hypothetical protein